MTRDSEARVTPDIAAVPGSGNHCRILPSPTESRVGSGAGPGRALAAAILASKSRSRPP